VRQHRAIETFDLRGLPRDLAAAKTYENIMKNLRMRGRSTQ
jgi:hypothetical protein